MENIPKINEYPGDKEKKAELRAMMLDGEHLANEFTSTKEPNAEPKAPREVEHWEESGPDSTYFAK